MYVDNAKKMFIKKGGARRHNNYGLFETMRIKPVKIHINFKTFWPKLHVKVKPIKCNFQNLNRRKKTSMPECGYRKISTFKFLL